MALNTARALAEAVRALVRNSRLRTPAVVTFSSLVVVAVLSIPWRAARKRRQSNHREDSVEHRGTSTNQPDDGTTLLTTRELEAMITRIENVTVTFIKSAGECENRDAPDRFIPYPYVAKANGDWTVAEFIRNRISQYEQSGLRAIVANSYNHRVPGGTPLRVVRSTFDQQD